MTSVQPAHGSEWQLQEAKNRLSEVVRRAKASGPQTITVRGIPEVVVVDADVYRKLAGERPRDETPAQFFRRWGALMAGVKFTREPVDFGRDIDFGGPEFGSFDDEADLPCPS